MRLFRNETLVRKYILFTANESVGHLFKKKKLFLRLEAVDPKASRTITSSAGDQCAGLSAHNSKRGCFSDSINFSRIDLHNDLKSFSVSQKKHCNINHEWIRNKSQISAHVVDTIFLATRSKVRKQLHVCIGIY